MNTGELQELEEVEKCYQGLVDGEQVIGTGPAVESTDSQHFVQANDVNDLCKEYHWWIRGACTGVKCRNCGVTDQLYENEHTW